MHPRNTRVQRTGPLAVATERHQPRRPTRPRLPVRPGDTALRRRRPDGRPPPLATNSRIERTRGAASLASPGLLPSDKGSRARWRPCGPRGQSRSSDTAPGAPGPARLPRRRRARAPRAVPSRKAILERRRRVLEFGRFRKSEGDSDDRRPTAAFSGCGSNEVMSQCASLQGISAERGTARVTFSPLSRRPGSVRVGRGARSARRCPLQTGTSIHPAPVRRTSNLGVCRAFSTSHLGVGSSLH